MSTGKTIFFTILMGVMIVAAILWAQDWQAQKRASQSLPGSASASIRNTLPDFSFPGLDGRQHRGNEWLGKVLVLNFWATWCPPCRKEMPGFIELQEELRAQGLRIVGVAIDDKAAVEEFTDSLGVNYPILLGENGAVQMARDLGNRFSGLPFTVVFDRSGRVAYFQAGEISKDKLRNEIAPLL